MKPDVRLSKSAAKKLGKLFDFLEKEWSIKVKKEFIKKLEKSLLQIQKLPDCCPESEKIIGLRKCVVTRQTTIFYKYSDKVIYIITIFDNRQNPKSLKNDYENTNI